MSQLELGRLLLIGETFYFIIGALCVAIIDIGFKKSAHRPLYLRIICSRWFGEFLIFAAWPLILFEAIRRAKKGIDQDDDSPQERM